MSNEEISQMYGKSKEGNFWINDTICVPHPYCVGPKHLKYSESVYLDIPGAEAKGARCYICNRLHKETGKPILLFEDHKKALIVKCKVDANSPEFKPELEEYLLSVKQFCIDDGYEGFAFMKVKEGEI